MNKILVISRGESDLTELIGRSCPEACIVDYTQPCLPDTESYDALAVLGGTEEEPLGTSCSHASAGGADAPGGKACLL